MIFGFNTENITYSNCGLKVNYSEMLFSNDKVLVFGIWYLIFGI